MDMYHAAKHWLCWAPTPDAAPLGPRNTMGQEMVPADMYSVFAAVFTMWSIADMEGPASNGACWYYITNTVYSRRRAPSVRLNWHCLMPNMMHWGSMNVS